MLNQLYVVMDFVASTLPHLYKVETIGDAYVISCGVTEEAEDHAVHVANFALLVRDCVKLVKSPLDPSAPLAIRIGMHSGSVISGVIGTWLCIREMRDECVQGCSVFLTNTPLGDGSEWKQAPSVRSSFSA